MCARGVENKEEEKQCTWCRKQRNWEESHPAQSTETEGQWICLLYFMWRALFHHAPDFHDPHWNSGIGNCFRRLRSTTKDILKAMPKMSSFLREQWMMVTDACLVIYEITKTREYLNEIQSRRGWETHRTGSQMRCEDVFRCVVALHAQSVIPLWLFCVLPLHKRVHTIPVIILSGRCVESAFVIIWLWKAQFWLISRGILRSIIFFVMTAELENRSLGQLAALSHGRATLRHYATICQQLSCIPEQATK